MRNINLYCLSLNYFKLIDKLPNFIKPIGLGNQEYPHHWLSEKNGNNIINFNKYFGQYTGVYWIWKNLLNDKSDDDWIGTCEYRKLWLNGLYQQKFKFSINSLFSNLLKTNNEIFYNCDAVLVQPIEFKRENINQQFKKVHGVDLIKDCINFVKEEEREGFEKFLLKNKVSAPPLFITKIHLFKKFCEDIFPILNKSLDYFKKNDLCHGYNLRLPACLIERYASYWFETNCNTKYLSHARLGKVMLSNKINKFINPIKIPFTLRMYPTIHKY
jgi:hypothetical protein